MLVSPTPFEFVDTHIHLVGWPVLVYLCWKLRGTIDKYLDGLQGDRKTLKDAEEAAVATKSAVDLIAGNHMKHMQESLGELCCKTDETNKTLGTMSASLLVLVDRGHRL